MCSTEDAKNEFLTNIQSIIEEGKVFYNEKIMQFNFVIYINIYIYIK